MAEKVITTDVDALMSLVEEKKRVSFEDASKELDLPLPTIENLSSFLEEERLLDVQYQLTTPYLVWREAEEAPKGVKLAPKPIEKKSILLEKPLDKETILQEITAFLNQGNMVEAKRLYKRAHELYRQLPASYISEKQDFEQQLMKLNTELAVHVDRSAELKTQENKAKIKGLLEQGKKHLKQGDWQLATKIYNEIKALHHSLPSGFVKERTELAENVLEFYEQLVQTHREQIKKEFHEKSEQLSAMMEKIRQSMSSHQLSEAFHLYRQAKEVYTTLPAGFLEEKLMFQERLLTLFRDLSVSKRTLSLSELREKAEIINRFLEQVNDSLQKQDIEKAISLYKEVRALYVSMPQGFLAEQREVHDTIIRVYKRLLKARQEHSVRSLKFSGTKISTLIDKAKHYLANQQADLAFQLYKEIIDEYNTLPEGYEREKVVVRDAVYTLYYDILSTLDLSQLGHLDDYARKHYFALLKLLITVHKVIDNNEFPLLPELYANIHRHYNELPIKIVQHRGKLVQEVDRVYTLVKIYETVESLDGFQKEKKYDDLQQALSVLGVELVRAGKESPEDSALLHYAKDRYLRYTEHIEGKAEGIPPYIPPQKSSSLLIPPSIPLREQKPPKTTHSLTGELTEEKLYDDLGQKKQIIYKREQEIRSRLDHLTRCKNLYEQAQQQMSQKNYNEAIITLGQLLALESNYPNARIMLSNLEKIKMDEYRGELLVSLVKNKKEKAIMRLAEHDYDGAIAYIKSILELDPINVEARYMLQAAQQEKAAFGRR